jgi:hypothetical protein
MAEVTSGRTGYRHPLYRASLGAWGTPRELPTSGGWLLVRQVPGDDAVDAIAGYPRLQCDDWSALGTDLAAQADLVSIVGVTDPFAGFDPVDLRRAFPTAVRPYKDHSVIDLAAPSVSAGHRARVRRVARVVEVEVDEEPRDHIATWERLYETLRRRHDLRGIKALSEEAFVAQLQVPGCLALRATHRGTPVSMLLWYAQEGVAYYHLGASSKDGYEISASYALFDAAIAFYRARGLRWLDLGANAGADPSADGLARFKRGWTPLTKPTWLCCRIGRPERYDRLVAERGASSFFPAYRSPDEA